MAARSGPAVSAGRGGGAVASERGGWAGAAAAAAGADTCACFFSGTEAFDGCAGVTAGAGVLAATAVTGCATDGEAMDGATNATTRPIAPTTAMAAAAGPSDKFVAMLRPAPSSRSMRSEMCLRVANTPGAGIICRGHVAVSAILVRHSA